MDLKNDATPLQIIAQSTGSINNTYKKTASIMQKDTTLGTIQYILSGSEEMRPAINYLPPLNYKYGCFQAAIKTLELTEPGRFYSRSRNAQPNLGLLLLSFAVKDLIELHGSQRRPAFVTQQPLHIDSPYAPHCALLFETMGFERIHNPCAEEFFYKLSVLYSALTPESPVLQLCNQHLIGIQTPLTSVETVPVQDLSISSEEEIPSKPAAPTISKEELRKTALAKLRTRANGKAKLSRTELEEMIAKTGLAPIRGISKKTDIKSLLNK